MKNYTGSYICLGLVYSKNMIENIKDCISVVLAKFTSKEYDISTYNEKTDESQQFTSRSVNKNEVADLLRYDSSTIRFDAFHENKETQVLISTGNLEDLMAVQINFHEATFLSYFEDNYECCEKFLQDLAVELYETTQFIYAFCDNEGNFDYDFTQMKKHGYKEYSIVYFPIKNGLEILKQGWELDGFTDRDVTKVGKVTINL